MLLQSCLFLHLKFINQDRPIFKQIKLNYVSAFGWKAISANCLFRPEGRTFLTWNLSFVLFELLENTYKFLQKVFCNFSQLQRNVAYENVSKLINYAKKKNATSFFGTD